MKKQSFSRLHVTVLLLADGELHCYTTIKFANNSFSGGIHFLVWNPVTPHLFAVDSGCSVRPLLHTKSKINSQLLIILLSKSITFF